MEFPKYWSDVGSKAIARAVCRFYAADVLRKNKLCPEEHDGSLIRSAFALWSFVLLEHERLFY